MNPVRFSPRVALLFAVALAASPVFATNAPDRPATPPHFTDALHVYNGCHLSTHAFLARFHAAFPDERAEPVVATLPNGDGVTRPHTVALLTWRGAWWCRDEYFGVFPLSLRVDATKNRAQLEAVLISSFNRHARAALRTPGRTKAPMVPAHLSPGERLTQVLNATKMLPFASTVVWVRSGSNRLPFVFFRVGPSHVGLYDPANGTCATDCSSTDDLAIVAAAARAVGYRVDEVTVDAGRPATLVASR